MQPCEAAIEFKEMAEERYNVLIVDPDSGSRGRLKQVSLSLTRFNKVFVCSSLEEALGKTDFPEAIDIVVVSTNLGEENITDFIRRAKDTRKGKEWAYMAVLKSAEQKNQIIAGGVLGGLDGFLFEPYSADNMREMAEITAAVKHRNALGRKRAAIGMIMREVVSHFDAFAFYRSKGKEGVMPLKRIRDALSGLPDIASDKEIYAIYVDVACEIFSNALPPAEKAYQGVSQRVRERLEAQALQKLEEKYR